MQWLKNLKNMIQ